MNETRKTDFDDLEYMHGEDSTLYDGMLYNGEPFTGVATDHFNGSWLEASFVNGKPHGRLTEVSEDGITLAEEYIEHGIILKSTYRYRNGNLHETYTKEPFEKKCWYMNGQLLSERTDEYTVTYYDDGAINSEQRKSDGVCIIYSRSGEWIAKTALDDKGLCVPGIDTTEFNERYMAKNYVTMLEDDIENLRYFNIWLMKKSAGSEITVFVQHKLSKIVGNLIRSNDLRVKYEGLNYADKYKLANLAALIRKQLKITNTPSQWNTKDGYGVHGYGFTISQRAERVLDSIKK